MGWRLRMRNASVQRESAGWELPDAVLEMFEVAFANLRETDGGARDAVCLDGDKSRLVDGIAPHAHGMIDVVFRDLVSQRLDLHTRKLQAEVDVCIFPAGPYKLGVESIDFFQIGFPNRKIAT